MGSEDAPSPFTFIIYHNCKNYAIIRSTISLKDAIKDCTPFEWEKNIEFDDDICEIKDAVLVKKVK